MQNFRKSPCLDINGEAAYWTSIRKPHRKILIVRLSQPIANLEFSSCKDLTARSFAAIDIDKNC
jgi:hypothetical protein